MKDGTVRTWVRTTWTGGCVMKRRILGVLLVVLLLSEGMLLYEYIEVSNELERVRALLYVVLGKPVDS